MDNERDLHALALLDEPTRSALYRFVVSSGEVSRDQAAAATGIGRDKAAFHLDRLVEGGLLEVSYRRPEGRRGPGAGRPAKFYRRSEAAVEVSMPARQYRLAGEVLADALCHLDADRTEAAIADAATRKARELAGTYRRGESVVTLLADLGFEPDVQPGGSVVLRNCPFQELAQTFAGQTCAMNKALVSAAVDAVATDKYAIEVRNGGAGCCVQLRARARHGGS